MIFTIKYYKKYLIYEYNYKTRYFTNIPFKKSRGYWIYKYNEVQIMSSERKQMTEKH